MSEFGNIKTPSMHPRLGSATLSLGRQPKFPMGEIPLGQYCCKKAVLFFKVWNLLQIIQAEAILTN